MRWALLFAGEAFRLLYLSMTFVLGQIYRSLLHSQTSFTLPNRRQSDHALSHMTDVRLVSSLLARGSGGTPARMSLIRYSRYSVHSLSGWQNSVEISTTAELLFTYYSKTVFPTSLSAPSRKPHSAFRLTTATHGGSRILQTGLSFSILP